MDFCADERKKLWRLLLFSAIGGCVLTVFTCTPCATSPRYFLISSSLSTICWVVLWGGNSYLGSLLDRSISWVKTPIKRLFVGMGATLIYTVVTIVLIMEFYRFALPFNFSADYSDTVYTSLGITILVSSIMHGRSFLLSWRQAAMEAERFEKESVKARYESLKNQVNPHFLFNSLNALTNLVYEDQDKAVKFIKQLSEVYRYVLDTRDKEVVPMEAELSFLKAFVFLQQIRFGESLSVDIDVSGKGYVTPLALQILVENAIKHNVVSREDPMRVTIREVDGFVEVKNNLQRKTMLGEPSSGLGLSNIERRYSFLTSQPVDVKETDGNFIVRIPLLASPL